jgi:hypothetical protein
MKYGDVPGAIGVHGSPDQFAKSSSIETENRHKAWAVGWWKSTMEECPFLVTKNDAVPRVMDPMTRKEVLT